MSLGRIQPNESLWKFLIVGAIVMCAAFRPRSSVAQTAAAPLAEDSAIARLTMSAVFERLGGRIAQAAVDTVTHPWIMSFPSRGRHWSLYEKHARAVLRARDPISPDSVRSTLTVESFEIRGDTVFAHFTLGAASKCRGEWKGGGTQYEMVAIKSGKFWEYPVVTKPIGHYDSISCRK